jgi:hypothetical protein
MIFDAICYLQKRTEKDDKRLSKEQIDFIKKVKDLSIGKIDGDCMGMSNLCLIISTYTDNDNIQNYTLDDLINIFNNIHDVSKVIREKTTNEFWKSFLFHTLDYLIDSYAAKYADDIKVLKEIGFDELWESELYSEIDTAIRRYTEYLQNFDIDKLFGNIQKMKNIDYISDCSIYISFMSYPTAFTLYNNCFLYPVIPVGNFIDLEMIAHELMHGFASDELINEYLKYIAGNEFLIEKNKKLNEYSGNEEEFVMAAGYYLAYLSKIQLKDEYIKKAKRNGDCPLSVIIFDMLTKEESVPANYNAWLIDKFINNCFPKNNIKEYIDSL